MTDRSGSRRRGRLSLHEQHLVFAGAALVVLAGFIVAFMFIEPPPPSTVTIATGGPGGAYHTFAERYQRRLAAEDIELRLIPTSGSVENIALLRDGRADLAFVQGGILEPPAEGLNALAAVFLEPVWVFRPAGAPGTDLRDLAGRVVAVGPDGSGTQRLADRLLAANGLTGAYDRRTLQVAEAAERLRAGELDAAIFVAAASSPLIEGLLADPALAPMHIRRAEAYRQRFTTLQPVVLREGVISLADNRPPRDVMLLAATASLVARDDFHPALVSLVLDIARDVHRPGDLFTEPGSFPRLNGLDIAADDEAVRFFERGGPPVLQRYFPFWIANLIDRWSILLIPLLTLLIPLGRLLPPVYQWRMRTRVNRWYRQLGEIEARAATGELSPADALDRIASIDRRAAATKVPLSFQHDLYRLRTHIEFMRQRLSRAE